MKVLMVDETCKRCSGKGVHFPLLQSDDLIDTGVSSRQLAVCYCVKAVKITAVLNSQDSLDAQFSGSDLVLEIVEVV